MSVKLKNRKGLHGDLNGYLDGIAVSSELIDGIMNLPVSEQYIPHVKVNPINLHRFFMQHSIQVLQTLLGLSRLHRH